MSAGWTYDDDSPLHVKARAVEARVDGALSEDGLLFIRFNGDELTIDDVEANIKVRRELVGDHTDVYALMDIRGIRRVAVETRHRPPNPRNKAVAVVYDSPVGRMIARAFHAQAKPKHEFELFTLFSNAVAWLRQQKGPS